MHLLSRLASRSHHVWASQSRSSEQNVKVFGIALAAIVTTVGGMLLQGNPPREFAASNRATVSVGTNDSLQSLVENASPGTGFLLKKGVHAMQSITPKDGDSFVGESGAVLSGAQSLVDFRKQGPYWVASVSVKRRSSYRGQCDHEHPACMFPEDVFIDEAPLERAASKDEVSENKWYLDYDEQKVYLGTDPTGHTVEISLQSFAFSGPARNVRIEGLIIEKYATQAGDGSIDARASHPSGGPGWIVQDCEIRWNHGVGIRTGDGAQILRNRIYNNGQLGVAGSGMSVMVSDNEIFANNFAGYDYGWEAGGTKFTFTRDLVVKNNKVHDNEGPGLWTDLENNNSLYEGNQTRGNKEAGILHEVSYRAVIRSNDVENDGIDPKGRNTPWYGGGILIAGSSGVEVYGNHVVGCTNGIVGTAPNRKSDRTGSPYVLRDLYVHDNVISDVRGVAAGIVKSSFTDEAVFTSWNNRFANNTFDLQSPTTPAFAWKGSTWTLAEWKKRFQEH